MFEELTGERLASTYRGFIGRKTVFGKTGRVIGTDDNTQGRTMRKATALEIISLNDAKRDPSPPRRELLFFCNFNETAQIPSL